MARDVCGETLWLSQPAGRWLDAFPIGNGRLGAMVFGGTEIERLALNHENLWRGVTRDRTTQPRHQHLAEIRERFFAREWIEGTELAVKYLCDWPYPVPSGEDLFMKTLGPDKHKEELVQPYQAFGDMTLDLGHAEVSDYRRSLSLDTGIAEVRYEVGGVSYRREVFASAEHQVIVLYLTTDTPGTLDLTVKLDRIADPACALKPWSSHDRLGFEGRFDEDIDFAAEARVAASGGETSPGAGASLHIRGADAVLIVLTMAVDYDQAEPAAWCTRHLDGAPMDVGALRAAHLAEHSAMYERVALKLSGKPEVESLPLDARLRRLRAGGDDPSLFALYFQYGRYLLMSSSRRCAQPATLQGLWNERIDFKEWGSSYVTDMNLEMNYWPAEVCNLPECVEPLFNYLERFIPQGRKAARDLYDCRGIVLPQVADVWARPTGYRLGTIWPSAAAWLAEHYWWRYEYTLDTDFLRGRAYPFLKLVAEFYEDYLVRDPEHGWLVTAPSISPENSFVGGTHLHSPCVAPTMDLILIREALTHCLQASEILGCDAELRPTWEAILDDLPPYQIGRHGQLQEWLEDFDEAEPGHRHMAHLIGVYPGEEMTPGAGADDLCQAARVSLERRLTDGGGRTGWSRAWIVAMWARFFEGGLAHEHLVHLLADFCTDSLLDLHPPKIFQIDGNLGGTAAIAELLLQSHGGVIRLLPALPPQWANGSVKGLRARGGFTIEMTWSDAALVEAHLTSELGQPCRLVWPWGDPEVTCSGKAIPTQRDASGYLTFVTEPGQCMELRPTHNPGDGGFRHHPYTHSNQ